MQLVFCIIATVIILSAIAAMTLRNPVHCALSLVLTFSGIAALFLQLGAQFIGFVQVLVYVGAVAILIVFAILLTRGSEFKAGAKAFSRGWWMGALVALLVSGCLAAAVLASPKVRVAPPAPPEATVKQIGLQMMQGNPVRPAQPHYVLPLEAAGLLLTAAMIGAAILAMPERRSK